MPIAPAAAPSITRPTIDVIPTSLPRRDRILTYELGYPTLVNIDVSFNTADEESYITVSDLLPTG